MGVVMATLTAASIDSSPPDTQDFTFSGLGTPTAGNCLVIFESCSVDSEDTPVDGYGFSQGMTEGTNEVCCASHSEDAVSTSNTGNISRTDRVIHLLNGDGTVLGSAEFDSFVTDGVRIKWLTVPADFWRVQVTIIWGADLEVVVGTQTHNGAQDGTESLTLLGLDPDTLRVISTRNPFDSTMRAGAHMSIGYANDQGGGVVQGSNNVTVLDAMSTSSVAGWFSNAYVTVACDDATDTTPTAIEIASLYADGFSFTKRNSADTLEFAYAAIQWPSDVSVSLLHSTSPSSNGTVDYDSFGVPLEGALICAGVLNAAQINTLKTAGSAGCISSGSFSRSASDAVSLQNENTMQSVERDNLTTTVNHSESHTTAVWASNQRETATIEASWDAWLDDGVKLNWTDTETGNKNFMMLGIEHAVKTVSVPLTGLDINDKLPTHKLSISIGGVTGPGVFQITYIGNDFVDIGDPILSVGPVNLSGDDLALSPLVPTVQVKPSPALTDLELGPLVVSPGMTVGAPLTDLYLSPLTVSPRVAPATALTVLDLTPLAVALRVAPGVALTDLDLTPLALSLRAALSLPLADLELTPLLVTPKVSPASPLTVIQLAPFTPGLQSRIIVPQGIVYIAPFVPSLVIPTVIALPLVEILIEGIDLAQLGAVMLTNKKRIYDALQAFARTGTFQRVTYDNGVYELIEGSVAVPASVVIQEVSSSFTPTAKRNRQTLKQDRDQWLWRVALRFQKEVEFEQFELALMESPIQIPLDAPNGLDQVMLRLIDSQYIHPPQQQPEQGSQVTFRFNAVPTPL